MELIKPKLLLQSDIESKHIIETILSKTHTPIDAERPNSRLRGTHILELPEGKEKIIAWQKNIGSLKGRTVELPTIVVILLNKHKKVEDIGLHGLFAGSKGPLCSYTYLNTILKKVFMGVHFTNEMKPLLKKESLKCFHLVEVISGAYSFYSQYHGERALRDIAPYEEEVYEGYRKGDDLIVSTHQCMYPKKTVHTALHLKNIFAQIEEVDGCMSRAKDITVSLYIEKTLLETVTITFNFEVLDYGRFMKMITKVSKEIRKAFFGYRVYPFYNTNFSPTALMGILTQSIGVYFTENRPENIMKVLNLLQRTKGRPQCPGGINSLHESEEYFPGLGEHLQNNPHAMDLLTKKNLASVAVNTL